MAKPFTCKTHNANVTGQAGKKRYNHSMRLLISLLFYGLSLTAPMAEPQPYDLQTELSDVGFTYRLNADRQRGSMPVQTADIRIDFDRLSRSSVTVTLNAEAAKTGFPFVADALRSRSVLDTANHPTLRFVSTDVSGTTANAKLTGNLTIRGVTKPVTLTARLYRQRGQAAGDLSKLTILLSGTVSRSAFGAGGFSEFVQDDIGLNIRARITRAD